MGGTQDALEKIRLIARKGFFHIFGASTVNKVLTALLGIALVWVMPKEEYGVWSYANNIIGFFIIVNGFGAPSALLQLCSEHYGEVDLSRSFYIYGVRVALLFDVGMCIIVALVGLFVPLALGGSNALLLLYCLYPLTMLLCELRLTWLRVRRENKAFAIMTNVQTVLLVLCSFAGAFAFSSVGLILGQYVAYFGSFLLLFLTGNRFGLHQQEPLTADERRDYWSIAPISAVNIGFSQVLTLIGTFLVGMLMADAADVANYKVATTIPFALMFIPGAIMTFAYPYFAEKRTDAVWTRKRYFQLTICSLIAFGLLTAFLVLIGRPLLGLLFGHDYEGVSSAYSILMLGFFFNAALRNPAGNLLVTQRKLKYNFFVNVATAVVSIVLSFLLIPAWGTIGAAWAYTISMIVSAILFTGKYVIVVKALMKGCGSCI